MVDPWFWCGVALVGIIAVIMLFKIASGFITGVIRRRRDKQWSELTKNSDKLILHCPGPAKTIPNASPFVMKILAYLRMTGIPYELDHTTPFGGKGKAPWISLNGESVADSECIIQFLTKKYGRSIKGPYTDEQVAVASALRIMLEERTYWGMILERFVYGSSKNLLQVLDTSFIARMAIKNLIKGRSEAQGIGGHSNEDIIAIISQDLRIVSKILGDKRFILGEDPCVEDAAIFGQLSQYCWGLPNCAYERLVNGECKNLKEYCLRVRELYFPDWK